MKTAVPEFLELNELPHAKLETVPFFHNIMTGDVSVKHNIESVLCRTDTSPDSLLQIFPESLSYCSGAFDFFTEHLFYGFTDSCLIKVYTKDHLV